MPRPPTGPISRTKWATLFSEQGGCCAGCFKPLGEDVHVDHVTPLTLGGADTFENLQLLHTACNLAKSDMRPDAWFRRCWMRFLAEQPKPERTQVTLSLDPQVAERLRFAAELARKSVSALIEESLAATVAAAGKPRDRPSRWLLSTTSMPVSAAARVAAVRPVCGPEKATRDLFEG